MRYPVDYWYPESCAEPYQSGRDLLEAEGHRPHKADEMIKCDVCGDMVEEGELMYEDYCAGTICMVCAESLSAEQIGRYIGVSA